jgi:hypothetical protein
MDRVEEIESAINALSQEDFRRIANWFRERDQSLWDEQLDGDASAGAIDFLSRKSRQSPSKAISAIGQRRGEIGRDPSILEAIFCAAE